VVTVPAGLVGVLQMALGLVLLEAGVRKIWQPRRFLAGVAEYDVVPSEIAPVLGILIIAGEFAAGVTQVVRIQHQLGAALGVALFVVFTFALCVALTRGQSHECHCSTSAGGDVISRWAVVRVGALLAVQVLVAVLPPAQMWSTPEGVLIDLGFAIFLAEVFRWLQLAPYVRILARLLRRDNSDVSLGEG